MDGNKQYVRSRWEKVIVCDGSYRHYAKGTVLLNWANHCFHEFASFEAAAEFTRQREVEIRQVEEEITLINRFNSEDHLSEAEQVTIGGILGRSLRALEDLKRGMKEQHS
jgi:hypothetical protein